MVGVGVCPLFIIKRQYREHQRAAIRSLTVAVLMDKEGCFKVGVKDELFGLVEPVVKDLGYDLVDLEYLKEGPRWVVRVYIFKPEGISLSDCQVVSEAIGAKLEEDDPVKTAYHLEVSSPGAERVLKNDREFKIFQGRLVKITTKEALGGEYVHYGRLGPVSDQNVQVTGGEGQPMTFSKDNVKQIRLALDPSVPAGS